MAQKAFFFDATRCGGCKTCEFSCKDAHDLDVDTTYRRVHEYTGGQTIKDESGCFSTTCFSYSISLACNHCSKPMCVQVCPTEAMHKDIDTGLVDVDAKRCVGCGYCHLACPYNAPKVDRLKGHSVKCDGCLARVVAGQMPVCVEACPARALYFGDAETVQGLGERASMAPLPCASVTEPNLYIKPSRDARAAESKEGFVGNPLEVC